MDEHTLLVVIAVFVFIAAVALMIQAGFLFGMYKAAREIQAHSTRVVPKVEALVISSQAALEESRATLAVITTKTNSLLDITQKQMHTVDGFLIDATNRAKVQMDRAEMFLDDTMERAQDTVKMVHGTVITPLRQVNGLAAGIKAAVEYFLRGNRPSPDRATVDEEMFI
jgi:hypothetical protein